MENEMKILIRNFCDDRIDDLLRKLPASNAEYAVAEEKRMELYAALEPIFRAKGDITLSAPGCENFREYLDREASAAGIANDALYRQGYLDCVRLLRTLGILT